MKNFIIMFYRTIAIKHLIRLVNSAPSNSIPLGIECTGEGLQIHLIKNIGITIYCTTRWAVGFDCLKT